jgi:hypothetical protein
MKVKRPGGRRPRGAADSGDAGEKGPPLDDRRKETFSAL